MNQFKTFTFLIIVILLIFEICSIIPQCFGPKVISVYKRNYADSNAYIKGYKTTEGSIEKFDVKVNPNGLWDRMLLTQDDDNVLSELIKIAAGLSFAFYIYQLSYDNIFSKKSFNLFWLTIFLGVMSYVAYDLGTDHTRDFFTGIYLAKAGNDLYKYDFQSGLMQNEILHNYGIYVWMPLVIMNLYKTFRNHHEGKAEGEW